MFVAARRQGVSIKERLDYVGHSTVSMQLQYTQVGRDRLREISQVIDRDVRETLGVRFGRLTSNMQVDDVPVPRISPEPAPPNPQIRESVGSG